MRAAANLLFLLAILAIDLRAAGLVVMIIGPPGSGRSTQAEILRKDRGMLVIAADDLIARNREKFERFRNPTIQGVDVHLDPALNQLVAEALTTADLSKGVVLDGYPAAKTQGDYLAGLREKLNLTQAIVIHLQVPDDVVRKRLSGLQAADLDQRLKDYHRELDFAHTYFPEANIHDIDGTRKREAVAKAIRKVLEQTR